jgi:proteasome lid subunit RPN8/RPN11
VLAKSDTLLMSWEVMLQIECCIGDVTAEHGGVLGGSRDDGIVQAFHFDGSARRSSATYSPDTASLKRLFAEDWNPRGINVLGFVHSHPPGVARPSGGDLIYAERILSANPSLARLLLPIVVTTADTGAFELLPYAAIRGDTRSIRIAPLTLVIGQFTTERGGAATPAMGAEISANACKVACPGDARKP